MRRGEPAALTADLLQLPYKGPAQRLFVLKGPPPGSSASVTSA